MGNVVLDALGTYAELLTLLTVSNACVFIIGA